MVILERLFHNYKIIEISFLESTCFISKNKGLFLHKVRDVTAVVRLGAGSYANITWSVYLRIFRRIAISRGWNVFCLWHFSNTLFNCLNNYYVQPFST